MDQALVELLKATGLLGEGNALSYIVLLLVGLGVVTQVLGRLLEAYEGLSEREPRRLRRLAEHCAAESDNRRFIENAMEREIFRKTLRLPVAVPLIKEELLKRLYVTGRFTLGEIRGLSPMLEPREGGQVSVRIDASTIFSFWWAAVTLFFLLVHATAYVLPPLFGNDLAMKVGALVVLVVYAIFSAFLGWQMRPIFLAHEARQKLEVAGLLAEDGRSRSLLDPARAYDFLRTLRALLQRPVVDTLVFLARKLRLRRR